MMDRSVRSRVFAILAGSAGNLVEWYDFFAFSYFAIYFASEFFPRGNPTTQLLNAAGVFAGGFVTRPIGGWLFGRLADKHGRRVSLLVSVLLMCGGSLMVALLPTYAKIGIAAPALLLVARLIQGLSVGGEYGASATYMSEVAVEGRRGFFASFQYATLLGGQLLGVLVLVFLQRILSQAELKAWGWRVPFVLGGAAALVTLFLRRALPETTSAEVRSTKGAGTIRTLLRYRRPFLTILGFASGGSLIFYTFTSYMQKYLVNTTGMDAATASRVMTAALFFNILMQPVFGAISDVVGRRTSMICFGVIAVILPVPWLSLLGDTKSALVSFALLATALAGISSYTSIAGLVKAEMFPMEVRALGVGLSHAIANVLFGGTAEYIALWLKSVGRESAFSWYVTGVCAVALVAALSMPTRPQIHIDEESEREPRA